MMIKSIRQIKNLKNKRVLLRVDFNVPLTKGGKIGRNEDYRIVRTLPTIKYLISCGAKIIIVAHLGRPDGKVVEKYRLDPVAKRLAQLLKKKVAKSNEIIGRETEAKINQLQAGDILMLENIRFDAREDPSSLKLRRGKEKLAQELAKLADIFVNDGFAVSHRDQASVSAIQRFLPSYAGLLLAEEIKRLARVMHRPKQPLVAIIGGAKMETKIKVIKNFTKVSKKVLLGGALANTVLHVMGVSVGGSALEPSMFEAVKQLRLTDNGLAVPIDGVMAKSKIAAKGRIDALADIGPTELILDIGPETIKLYGKIIATAKTVVWNGPMGLIENPAFAKGTIALIKILAKSKAETIVGGGETVEMIRKLKFENEFSFVSTGGGAMLEFLEGKKLPGLKNIVK